MSDSSVHFEVFVRKTPTAGWTLDQATENRTHALAAAEELLRTGRVASVRVVKETLDAESGTYMGVEILNRGIASPKRSHLDAEPAGPLCVGPDDLYSAHARDRIGRLLDGWLRRHSATAWELLHRPDLAEELEASTTDLRHAVQKISLPEAQAGKSLSQVMEQFQTLADRTIARLTKDGRGRTFPDLQKESFAEAAERLRDEPDAAYRLGGGVAGELARVRTAREKVERLLDLADAAPEPGPARALAVRILCQPLGEILASRAGLADLVGRDLDLGGSLAALTRMAAGPHIQTLARIDPNIKKQLPELDGPALRLAQWLERGGFEEARAAVAKRVMEELRGPRRLRPESAEDEILMLRALAMGLTAAAGDVIDAQAVHDAFSERSRALVSAEFVESYVGRERTAVEELRALVWLAENLAGAANKRAAARYMAGCAGGLKLERELRENPQPAPRLAELAELQRLVAKAGLPEADVAAVNARLGELGGQIEADAGLVVQLSKGAGPVLPRLAALLRLASGETGPKGPAADRAKQAALKLARTPEVRDGIAASPQAGEQLRGLMAALAA
ncbi:MAG TPA: hypothetical protein VF699_10640 [Caulobacteraceae bacterium]